MGSPTTACPTAKQPPQKLAHRDRVPKIIPTATPASPSTTISTTTHRRHRFHRATLLGCAAAAAITTMTPFSPSVSGSDTGPFSRSLSRSFSDCPVVTSDAALLLLSGAPVVGAAERTDNAGSSPGREAPDRPLFPDRTLRAPALPLLLLLRSDDDLLAPLRARSPAPLGRGPGLATSPTRSYAVM